MDVIKLLLVLISVSLPAKAADITVMTEESERLFCQNQCYKHNNLANGYYYSQSYIPVLNYTGNSELAEYIKIPALVRREAGREITESSKIRNIIHGVFARHFPLGNEVDHNIASAHNLKYDPYSVFKNGECKIIFDTTNIIEFPRGYSDYSDYNRPRKTDEIVAVFKKATELNLKLAGIENCEFGSVE